MWQGWCPEGGEAVAMETRLWRKVWGCALGNRALAVDAEEPLFHFGGYLRARRESGQKSAPQTRPGPTERSPRWEERGGPEMRSLQTSPP